MASQVWTKKNCLRACLCVSFFLFTANLLTGQSVVDPSTTNPDYNAAKLRAAQLRKSSSPPVSQIQGSRPEGENATIISNNCFIPRDASYIPVPRNDDGSFGPIALPFTYSLYGTNYTQLWINTNGNLTFTAPLGQYTPDGFPILYAMVAAFWADVDTRAGAGQIYYKLNPTNLIVTWDSVGYFNVHTDKLNTFQIILTNGTDPLLGNGNHTAFYYRDMQWTTGDASSGSGGFGGAPATVGVSRDATFFDQIGRFNTNTSNYDGPGGFNDGVHYLDNKCFIFSGGISCVNEICSNGVDDDCDGLVDESCANYYRDSDGDGYGDPATQIFTGIPPVNYVPVSGDCNDANASIHPGATEVCNFVDDDCDGTIDEGCTTFYRDDDGDGYGQSSQQIRAMTRPPGYATVGGDCNDANPAVNPGATEICNGINDNCNGLTDEGCTTFYRDVDNDGFGRTDQTIVGTTRPPGYATLSGDCNDFDFSIHPGATEVCNFKDDDCDGLTDEGCQVFYRDQDNDGFGLWDQQIRAMTRPAGYATIGGDCNDTNAAVHPGAIEICNGINDNCNGLTDEGCTTFYRDVDGDGYGRTDQTIVATTRPPGYATVGGDCDDFTASIHPGAIEVCNFRDDDCDGIVDEGCMVFYRDQDGDGYGLWHQQIRAMTRPAGYATIGGDCNDTVAAINPGAIEICNGINDNCNGLTDEGCTTFYRDADNDGYGRTDQTIVATVRPPGYATIGGDCNDFDPAIHPGAIEVCNFKDDDCDGLTDEGCMVFYRDQDGDGYGLWDQQIRAMTRPPGYATIGGDCNDANAAVHPGAIEICNGINDNCNALTDEGCTTFYRDADNDGYGRTDQTIVATVRPPGYATIGGDCNDFDPAIRPGAIEVCNFKDDDCDGLTDEGCMVFYRDQDGDGYGLWDQQIRAMTRPPGYATIGGDCNDTVAAINPGAIEICNGINDNCNALTDEGCTTFYRDADNDGYGRSDQTIVAPVRPAGYATLSGDCNDFDPSINPGAIEICNFRDDNCDGVVDPGCMVFYRDQDGDTYGLWNQQIRATTRPPGYATIGGDCNDTNAAIHPGATEICNGINDDCDGATDEFCITGRPSTNGIQLPLKEDKPVAGPAQFEVVISPNPTSHLFSVHLNGSSDEGKITIRVFNNLGRLVEMKDNLSAGQTVKIGAGYTNGVYILEARQGATRKTVKIIKL